MKKFYFLFLLFFSALAFAQPYSILLKDADWTINKIVQNGTEYFPPAPFAFSGKTAFNFDGNNALRSDFYNTAVGSVNFAPDNAAYFYAQISGITLAEYYGENDLLVNQFDQMVTNFYFGFQTTDQFPFVYEQIFSGKNLVVTNPAGNKIFYSNLILGNAESNLNNKISIYPNPAKNEFFLKGISNLKGKINVEIYDTVGKLISTQNIMSSESVNTQKLINGNYFIKISGSTFNFSTELIIRK